MYTAAENYVSESEAKICLVRDYLIAICATMGAGTQIDEREAVAIHRLAETALDEITSLESDFDTAFRATFGSGPQPR